MTTPIFAEIADTFAPRERRGRKKHANCPVCKMPRNLREQVLDEAIAVVKSIPSKAVLVAVGVDVHGFAVGYETAIADVVALLTSPVEKPTQQT